MDRAVDDGRIAPTKRWFRQRALGALGLAAALARARRGASRHRPSRRPSSPPRRATQPRRCGKCATATPPSICSAPSTRSTSAPSWFDRSVRAAFDRSGELVLETIAPTDPAEVRAIGRSIAGPRPAPNGFLAATRSAVERGRADGLSVEHGADSVLRRAAADQGMSAVGDRAVRRPVADLRAHFRCAARSLAPLAAAAPTAPVTLADLARRRGKRATRAPLRQCSPGSRPRRRSPIAC